MRAERLTEEEGPRTVLGESPRWDGYAWWWVDATDGVWTCRPGRRAERVWHTGERTSLVQPATAGRVVVARRETLDVLEHRGSGWEPAEHWCDLSPGEGWLVNDGVADSRGRLWIGTIAPDRSPHGGTLVCVEPDGTAREAARGFTLSNGLAWDPTGSRLFHADTFERTVWAHSVDVATAEVTGSVPFITVGADEGLPDGLATDVDGGVWVAMYGAGHVRRYDADGRLDVVVEVDTPQCTSVALGGPDGHDVLITTAREGYDDEQSAREPNAGRLYRSRSEHAALPVPLAAP